MTITVPQELVRRMVDQEDAIGSIRLRDVIGAFHARDWKSVQLLTRRTERPYRRSPPMNPGRISSTNLANRIERPFVTTICLR